MELHTVNHSSVLDLKGLMSSLGFYKDIVLLYLLTLCQCLKKMNVCDEKTFTLNVMYCCFSIVAVIIFPFFSLFYLFVDCGCREAVLHWEAVGNPRCRGTWKKIQKTGACDCPPQHSFVFI